MLNAIARVASKNRTRHPQAPGSRHRCKVPCARFRASAIALRRRFRVFAGARSYAPENTSPHSSRTKEQNCATAPALACSRRVRPGLFLKARPDQATVPTQPCTGPSARVPESLQSCPGMRRLGRRVAHTSRVRCGLLPPRIRSRAQAGQQRALRHPRGGAHDVLRALLHPADVRGTVKINLINQLLG